MGAFGRFSQISIYFAARRQPFETLKLTQDQRFARLLV